MFYDREDCINLVPYVDEYGTKSGIFLFKNVLPEKLMQSMEEELASFDSSEFKYTEGLIPWYEDKVSGRPTQLHEMWEFLSELIGPEYVIHPSQSLIKVKPGDGGMFIHSDSPGKGQCHLLSQDDKWSTCCIIDFGLVAYVGTWEGGALFYPNLNSEGKEWAGKEPEPDKCFEYTPKRGDVVLHSAFHPFEHGVREVTDGIRYAFSNFSLPAADNIGTFYNYGTPEYIEQIGDKGHDAIETWITPLKKNPRFTPERLAEMKQSGLLGEDLSAAYGHVEFDDLLDQYKKEHGLA